MLRFLSRRAFLLSSAALLGVSASSVKAQLTITATGAAQGLTLTTFATGFPVINNGGPIGIAFSNGGVLVTDVAGNLRRFPSDSDGQNAASVPVLQNFGVGSAAALAQVGGNIYMGKQGVGVVQLNANGTVYQNIATGFTDILGIAGDPFNNHLFASDAGSSIIYDVDPIARTKTPFVSAQVDGLSLSPDGKTLYGASSTGHILGFSLATKAKVFDSGFIPGGVDGTAAGIGQFANDLFVNTNSGTLYEINLNTLTQTLIASQGTRGDFVTVDPTNDTLLITQTDRIMRLNGATFTATPEPGMLTTLAGTAFFGVTLLLRHRRKQSA